MDMDSCKILSTPPNVEENFCMHLLVANIGDKQHPWHPVPTTWEIEHLAFQSTLQ